MMILITGVSRGLGAELARQYLEDGHSVYGISRTAPIWKENLHISKQNRFFWRPCDITDQKALKIVFEDIRANRLLPDVIILNAGQVTSPRTMEFNYGDCESMFRVNCFGALYFVEEFLNPFWQRKAGQFVYISSVAAYFPFPFRHPYSASKSYMSMAFACLGKQYFGSGVGFSCIYPGLLNTGMSKDHSVPQILRYPVDKAAQKIIRAIKKRRRTCIFPIRGFLFELALQFIPTHLLLRLLQKTKSA